MSTTFKNRIDLSKKGIQSINSESRYKISDESIKNIPYITLENILSYNILK